MNYLPSAASWLLPLVLVGCTTTRQAAPTTAVPNKFADATLRELATAQDERNTQALRPFLQNPKARYRQEAASAFGSVQDRAALPDLLGLLSDTTAGVRQAAAYALGQTADSAAVGGLAGRLTTERNPLVRRYLLEALGKCVGRTTVSTLLRLPVASDTLLPVGQAWGFYRAGLRGLTSESIVSRAVSLLAPSQPVGARLAAAHTLARTPRLDLTVYLAPLTTAATTDVHFAVRAAATTALGKVKEPTVATTLSSILRRDADYHVRINALRAMNASMYVPVKEAAWAALDDANQQVAVAAAEFFQTHATGETGQLFLDKAARTPGWRARSILLAAALHHANSEEKPAIRTAIEQRFGGATNPYERAFLLKALGEDPEAYSFIETAAFTANQPHVVATYGLEALVALRSEPDFPATQQAAFKQTLERAFTSNDVALIATAATAISDLKMRGSFTRVPLLRQAQQQLQLPREVETWLALQQAINYLENNSAKPTPPADTKHPIDWAVVQAIPVGQRAVVHTSRGDVVLRLLVEEAPGSVASFVTLVRQGFYNDKYFHRVVPNFVVQGGDPRGDGYGGTDYTLRSEFADLRYGTGSVGLASAGKDTESCQWFITHSPTPHLDGRYTIFAQVERGMDVVHRLDIGDLIKSVELR